MKNNLKPYLTYKDSEIPWVGNVPNHWAIERGKRLFKKMDRPVRDSDEVITCFRDGVVTLRKNRRVRGFTESLKEIGYQGISRGDLVIHAMDAFAGAVGVSDSDGKGTPVYSVCKPLEKVNPYYYAFLVREMARSQWILALAKGIRERSTDFRFNEFAVQNFPLPPLEEQTAIVRYLDYMDRRIKRFIRAKQKLIKLLNEQKQAIIHQAVTRGLDPNVPLKPSGVEWLGDIPENWKLMPLKRCAVLNSQTLTEQTDKDYEFEYIDIGSVQTGYLAQTPKKIKFGGAPSRARRVLHQGDTIISTVRTYLKAIWYVNNDNSNLIASTGFAVLTPLKIIEPELLSYIIQSKYFIENVSAYSVGTTYPAINESILGRFLIAFPKELHEQKQILNFLKSNLKYLENTILSTQKEISLLKEYQTRLIADVVTGKLDVRQAAAALPDELEEETLDESDMEDVGETHASSEDDAFSLMPEMEE